MADPAKREDIESQYQRYKEQFEQWKETNRQAIGTEAYVNYVEQFEAWERDVMARRAAVSANREAASSTATTTRQNDEEAARAYAMQQDSYMRMHQRGMAEDAMRGRFAGATYRNSPGARASPLSKPAGAEISSVMSGLSSLISTAIRNDNRSPADAAATAGGPQVASATISAPPVMHSQQAPAVVVAQQQEQAFRPPQLWWGRQPEYGPLDRMFRVFGARAAPTTSDTSDTTCYNPGWLVQREMNGNSLGFPCENHMPLTTLHPSQSDPPKPIPSLITMDVDFPKDFSIPPPNFRGPPPSRNLPPPQVPPNKPVIPNFNPFVPPPPLNLPPPAFQMTC